MQSITNYLDIGFKNTEKLNYLMDMYFTEPLSLVHVLLFITYLRVNLLT